MRRGGRGLLAVVVLGSAMLALGACAARAPLVPPGPAPVRAVAATRPVVSRPAPVRPAAAAPTRANGAALTATQKDRLFRRFVEFRNQQAAW